MKRWIDLLALVSLVSLVGCGSSGGGSSVVNPPPVQAQSGYSNSSINGTYSIMLSRGDAESDIGSFKADGNGKITNGTLTVIQGIPGQNCPLTFTGSYSLQSTAAGTGTITTQPSTAPACANLASRTLNFTIQAAQSGDTILIAESDDVLMYSGSASKQ
ncbi:MAG: hypothetical protein WCA10_25450 [Terracidiphilus sp.]